MTGPVNPLPGCRCDTSAVAHKCRLHPMRFTCRVRLVAESGASRECNLVTQGGRAGYDAHLAMIHGIDDVSKY